MPERFRGLAEFAVGKLGVDIDSLLQGLFEFLGCRGQREVSGTMVSIGGR